MWFKLHFHLPDNMRSKPKLTKLPLMLVACAFFILTTFHMSNAQVGTTAQATATMTGPPESQPLILLWQATVAPDDLVFGANFVTVDDSGNCYVSSNAGFPVKKFDTDGKAVATWGGTGSGDGKFSYSTGLAVDLQGNLFVSDFSNTLVQKFDKNGKFLTKWSTEAPNGPTGIGVDSKGNVYVANHHTHDHYIQKFDNTGKLLTEWGSTGTGDGQFRAGSGSGIAALVVDNQDNVYVTDPDNDRIQKFDSDGKFLAKFGSPGVDGNGQFAQPFAVAVDSERNIYVNDGLFIQKLDPDGKFLAQWATGLPRGGPVDLDGAQFIAVDKQGNLFIIANAEVTLVDGSKTIMPVLKKFKQP